MQNRSVFFLITSNNSNFYNNRIGLFAFSHMKPIDKKKLYRKYRLHQKIKGLYRFKPSCKIIFVPFDDDLQNKYLNELQTSYNYQIQLEIPN
jgi:hypothetical protein